MGCEAHLPRVAALSDGEPAEFASGFVSVADHVWDPHVGPGCERSEYVTSTSPVIEILSSGGLGGDGWGNLRIWEDGTVLFDGAACPDGSGRRGKMSPDRVRDVIGKLEVSGFFQWSCDDASACDDFVDVSLTVRRPRAGLDHSARVAHRGAAHTVVDTGCGPGPSPSLATQAIELVMQGVGKNACNWECIETPVPASCR